MNPRDRPTTSPIRTTPKNITPHIPERRSTTPIRKPAHKPITPKYLKPLIPKQVTSPIHLYVISDVGKLVRPHSPIEPPPPLPKPKFKRPVCKNPTKI